MTHSVHVPTRRSFLKGVSASLALSGPFAAAAFGASSKPLKLATFQADVTPPVGAPLCHGNVKPVAKVDERLTARGVILFPGGEKPIVLCIVDFVNIGNASNNQWREALADAVGTTPERVTVHTVHLHTAPGVDASTEAVLADHDLSGAMFSVQAEKAALAATAKAAAEAMKSELKTVTHLGLGKGRVEKFASTRRLLGPDGKVAHVRMSSCRDPKVRAMPEEPIDPDVRIVAFFDGETPLAAMSYYATHPQSHYNDGSVNQDTIGVARRILEKDFPGTAILHFDGAGGDIAAGKYNDGSPEKSRHPGQTARRRNASRLEGHEKGPRRRRLRRSRSPDPVSFARTTLAAGRALWRPPPRTKWFGWPPSGSTVWVPAARSCWPATVAAMPTPST